MSKARNYARRVERDRAAWKDEALGRYPACWVCGAQDHESPLVVHEMAKRSQAPNKWGERCNYFLACNPCNCAILQQLGIEYQLALKLLRDPEHFDRQQVNVLRGRAPDAVSEQDLVEVLADIAREYLQLEAVAGQIISLQSVLERISERGTALPGQGLCALSVPDGHESESVSEMDDDA